MLSIASDAVAAEKVTAKKAATEKAAAAEMEEVEKKLAVLEKMLEDAKIEAERAKQETERLKRETEEEKMASLIKAEKARREAEEKKLVALERLLEDTKHEAEKAKKMRQAADEEAAIKEAIDKGVKEEVKRLVAERAAAPKKKKRILEGLFSGKKLERYVDFSNQSHTIRLHQPASSRLLNCRTNLTGHSSRDSSGSETVS